MPCQKGLKLPFDLANPLSEKEHSMVHIKDILSNDRAFWDNLIGYAYFELRKGDFFLSFSLYHKTYATVTIR